MPQLRMLPMLRRNSPRPRPDGLREELEGWQIFFITISAVIGVMIFYSDGKALAIAGPSGVILALVVVGAVTICVMECVSELAQMFPTSNAIVEYVRIFVDREWAWIVGMAYWYTFSAIFATQIIKAAEYAQYWNAPQAYQTIFFYAVGPVLMFALNTVGVFWFGIIETIGGALKICMVFGAGIYTYNVHREGHLGSRNINGGFKNDDQVASNPRIAGSLAIPIIAYGFLGVEAICVTAVEAKDINSIRRPSRIIAWFVLLLYLFCAIGELHVVNWRDVALPRALNSPAPNIQSRNLPFEGTPLNTSTIVVIAARRANEKGWAGLLNGCAIFSALSAANTSLYVASRVLYGMASKIESDSAFKSLRGLGSIWNQTGVPVRALFVSTVAFAWLPFLRLKGGIAIDDLFEIMSVSSSVSCLIVWATLCLAFIRYWFWFRVHKDHIRQTYPEHDRNGPESQSKTVLAPLQPLQAIVGLVGSLVIVFGFTTATWWDKPANFRKVASVFGAPVILFTCFVAMKIYTRRGWVALSSSETTSLEMAIEQLKRDKLERADREPRRYRRWGFTSRKVSADPTSDSNVSVPLSELNNSSRDNAQRRRHENGPHSDINEVPDNDRPQHGGNPSTLPSTLGQDRPAGASPASRYSRAQ